MVRLIVNADDLGSSAARDRGILTAFQRGIVTSASLLANGGNFLQAAAAARASALPTGVHLNLSEGRPLAGAIAGLTDTAGNFPGKTPLRARLLAGELNRGAVRRELLAQIARVRDAGLTPDHLDTHQHCLLFPALTGILVEVAQRSGVRALRLPQPAEPQQPGRRDAGTHGAARQRGSNDTLRDELALYRTLAPAARQVIAAGRLWTPDGLWGMPLLNRLDERSLAQLLARLPEGTWELMTHPGYRDPADPFGGPERETELAALTAPAIRRLIVARAIQLTSFGRCTCGC